MSRTPLHLLGARGLLAGELLRLVDGHPWLELAGVYSRDPESALAECHPQLRSGLPLQAMSRVAQDLRSALGRGRAALVLALPHGVAQSVWRELESELGESAADLAVVDLSADHRLVDDGAEGEGAWRYGLPELHGAKLPSARCVAAPGCFATAMQLAVLPPAWADLLDVQEPWILHAVTGSSGSGASARAGTHHPFRHGNFVPYAWNGHRHEPELLARRNFAEPPALRFVTCSGPFSRGIYLTAFLPLARGVDEEQVRSCFAKAYADRPFVQVLDEGVPQLRAVVGSNRADLGLSVRGDAASRTLQVFLALDNTLKGGVGQGLQCLNLMLGLAETDGLPRCGLGY